MRSNAAQRADDGLLQLQGATLDGRFEVVSRLAFGSFAEIYRARNLAPREDEPEAVVVKALNVMLWGLPEPELERTLLENIELEARALMSLRHEHIVRLYAFGTARDRAGRSTPYLVLEHVPGGSLTPLCRAQPLPFDRALDLVRQICAALAYAHAQGVLHRDVKPDNILLSEDLNLAKLTDFGTARLLAREHALVTLVGTETYAAPEHFSRHLDGGKLTAAADVYGLAKTVYYMLCGSHPYAFKQRQITFLPDGVSAQPWAEAVLRVLSRATREHPADRQQTALEFYDELSAATEQTLHTAKPSPAATHAPERKGARIVVEFIPPAERGRRASAEGYWRRAAGDVKRAASVAVRDFKLDWTALLPRLARGFLVPSPGRRFKQYWRMGPRGLRARIAAVTLLALVLLVVPPFLLRWQHAFTSSKAQGQEEAGRGAEDGATATTDINLRSAPNPGAQRVGLVERGSLVRILSVSGDQKWCEIEIVQHGRDKKVQSSPERGWVRRKFLREAR